MNTRKDLKKVLIVVYYWPPSGGGGVQRWLKFAKYLRDFGWEPVIYAPKDADYPQLDDELIADIPKDIQVIKKEIWEPYKLYRKFVGNKEAKPQLGAVSGNEKKSLKKKLSYWVRGNLFIPDAKMYWVKPSYKFLKKFLPNNNIQHVITTGPPHSLHLIGYKLQKNLGVKWIVDFRDPWFHLDNLDEFKLSKRAMYKQQKWRSKVVTNCSKLIVLTNFEKEKNSAFKPRENISIIRNGFDEEDFKEIKKVETSKFVIGHYGTMGEDRNPKELWQALSQLVKSSEMFREKLSIQLVGPTDPLVFQSINDYGLNEYLDYIDYLPHKSTLALMKSASVLLLLINNNHTSSGRLTGKIFEYMAMEVPILGVGVNDGEAGKLLKQTETGIMFDFNDSVGIRKCIEEWFKGAGYKATNGKINAYTRRALTQQLSELLDSQQ